AAMRLTRIFSMPVLPIAVTPDPRQPLGCSGVAGLAAGGPSGTADGGRFFAFTESAAARAFVACSTARASPAWLIFQEYLSRSTLLSGMGTSTYRERCVMSPSM